MLCGNADFSAAHLSALIAAGHTIDAVYTQPDRPSGRGKKLQPSPVKAVAMAAGLEIKQPVSLKTVEAQQELAAIAPDLLVVVAYGLILPQAVLELPKLGCINVHASLLPRWRGAAPIERALLAGDPVSGVTIMKMDAGLDTGDMLYKQQVEIGPEDDRISLTDKICDAGKWPFCIPCPISPSSAVRLNGKTTASAPTRTNLKIRVPVAVAGACRKAPSHHSGRTRQGAGLQFH